MFKLEQALADWRRRMHDAGIKAPVVLDELESHLRDEIDTLLQSGLNERQAFESAVERIGEVEALRREFAKEQRFKNAILFAVMGLYSLVGGIPVLFRLGSFSDVTTAQQVCALAAVAITAIALFAGRWFGRLLPGCSRRLLFAIAGAGVMSLFLWLAIFYWYVMTQVAWDVSQLVVAILWAIMPTMVFCGIMLGMEEAGAERTPKTHV